MVAFEGGTNDWRQFTAWPPPGVVQCKLFLRPHGGLSFDPPEDEGQPAGLGFDEYESDPAKPVPVRSTHTHGAATFCSFLFTSLNSVRILFVFRGSFQYIPDIKIEM